MYVEREFLSVEAVATAVATPALAQTLSAPGTTTTGPLGSEALAASRGPYVRFASGRFRIVP
jgi:hypothetical protein